MSKAFTSEETPELAPVVREPPRTRPGELRYITPEGLAALRDDRDRLRAEIARAGPLPDADRAPRAAELEGRLALVEGTLAVVTVLGPEAAPEGTVAFATWVTIEDEEGERSTWRLVGPDESDPRRGLVSAHSPVGRALLGHRVGDEVEVTLPGGERVLTIVAARRSGP